MVKLSAITPAAPGRIERVRTIISRLSLNQYKNPDIKFEYILVDDSLSGEYRAVCEAASKYLNIKYIWLPLEENYPNPAYMRNCGFRIAEGEVVCLIDVDWWIGENFIKGAIEPFQNNKNLLNTGYMIDTNKSQHCKTHGFNAAEQINDILMGDKGLNKQILDIFKAVKVPEPRPWHKRWLWAALREHFLKINGYDEVYCVGRYSREDDDLYERLTALPLSLYKGAYNKFCGLHMYHPQVARQDSKNKFNRDYYDRTCKPVRQSIRNKNHEWGKLVKYGFSIINGAIREHKDHELWIKENIGIRTYEESQPWGNFDELIETVRRTEIERK
jgi:glycosyltransferase involved in cell wall biosynthesis